MLLTRLVGARSPLTVAVKARVWPGTLHRYMTGEALPPTAAPLEAIGNACAATEWQLNALVEAWARQKHPPVEAHHGGYVFRGDRRSGPGTAPADVFHRALHAVWRSTGQLEPIAGSQDGAAKALREWQLDRLLSDDALRTRIRRALAPDALPPDPDALERRIAAAITVGYERGRSREALDLIGAGLLHRDESMRRRARKVLSAEPPAPLGTADRRAILAAVRTGARSRGRRSIR